MNLADFTVIAILGFMVFRGFKRGLVVSVIRTFSLLIALAVAKLFHTPFADFIFKTFRGLREEIYAGVRTFVINGLPDGGGGGIDFSALLQYIAPDLARTLPKELSGDLRINVSDLIRTNPTVRAAIDTLTSQIAAFVIHCISFVALFILMLIGIEIAVFVFGKIRKLPVIGTFDRLMGGLLGAVQGWLICTVIMYIVVSLSSAGYLEAFSAQIHGSSFAYKLMDFSLIQKLIMNVMEITAF